jgi:AcrR family transcriptional regulator
LRNITGGPSRLAILRAAEATCAARGVEALSLASVAEALDVSPAAVAAMFHDESALLDALVERHQSPYERRWEEILPDLTEPRDALRLLASTITSKVHDEDGGATYVSVVAQMCTSARFPLTARTATTTSTALKLMGKLTPSTLVPFGLIPIRFERVALVLFSSVVVWHRQGPGCLAEALFVEDLVDTLSYLTLGAPSAATQALLDGPS